MILSAKSHGIGLQNFGDYRKWCSLHFFIAVMLIFPKFQHHCDEKVINLMISFEKLITEKSIFAQLINFQPYDQFLTNFNQLVGTSPGFNTHFGILVLHVLLINFLRIFRLSKGNFK